jgi:Fe-S-cluster containining protein
MFEPSEVYEAGERIRDENMAFRTFLKSAAEPAELDEQFRKLHDELFAGYDCCQCNNCCRIYAVALRVDEAESIAEYLGMSTRAFADEYLFQTSSGGYGIDGPCPFLRAEDGKCVIHECKPTVCRNYPHTNQPDRMGSLLNIISLTEECPVVYEMIERLKKIYGFVSG